MIPPAGGVPGVVPRQFPFRPTKWLPHRFAVSRFVKKQHTSGTAPLNKMNPNRRNFLKTASVGCAAAWGLRPRESFGSRFQSANERPVVGFVGAGIRFHSYLGPQALKYGPCAGIADVDAMQLGRAYQVAVDAHRESKQPINIGAYEDYRRLLDRQDVDVIVCGTVDHWHTKVVCEAMLAGKDVYCEKPLTLTIHEGQQIAETMERTGRVVQVGTQQRTEFDQRFVTAVAMMRDNRVGDPRLTTVCIGGSRECDPLPLCDPPKTLNWDLWQGQTPVVPYRAASDIVDVAGWGAGFPFGRTHRYYRWFYEYSGGKLTDWGAHHVDVAMWALNKLGSDIGPIKITPLEVTHPVELKDGYPVSDDRFNCATKFNVRCEFADGTEMHVRDEAPDKGFVNGIMFEGAKGRFLVNRGKLVGRPVEELDDQPLPEDAIANLFADPQTARHAEFGKGGFHMRNFMECVKSRRVPASDVVSHNRMLNVCHAINTAMRLERPVTYDPSTETFGDDQGANSFLKREQRKGYETVI